MTIKSRLRVVLAEKEMSGKELCELTGLSSTSISSIVNNRRSPTLENALKIAKVLELKVEDIWEIQS